MPDWQLPLTHVLPAPVTNAQSLPQPPQFRASFRMSAQAPGQQICPAGQ
jgi:hypothetical protein